MSLLNFLARPIVDLWLADSPRSWRSLPVPLDSPSAHSNGIDPDRILLLGGGTLVGFGVASHELSLGGNLARRLTFLTGRGADVEIRARAEYAISDAIDDARDMDFSRFDAVLAAFGNREALELGSERQFMVNLERALNDIATRYPRLNIFLLGIPPMSSMAVLPTLYARLLARHRRAFNAIMARAAEKPLRSFVPLDVPVSIIQRDSGRELYAYWAAAVAPFMVDPLDEANTRFSSPSIDEDARNRALASMAILDRPLDLRFTQIVESAKNLLGTQAAALNFVTAAEQITKFSTDATAGNLEREKSPCSITIERPELNVIDDLASDPRFRHLPWVVDGAVRFYAGYPIESPDGFRVGALCVTDRMPRSFSSSDHSLLRQLAIRLQGLVWEFGEESQVSSGSH